MSIEVYLSDVFVIIKSIKVDLFCTLEFGLVGELSYTKFKESNSSLKQSEVPESQSQFSSPIRMKFRVI